jgi:predicted nucleic acid-binding protein
VICAGTNVWVDHFRREEPMLSALLAGEDAVVHPYVIGELALGHLPNRTTTLAFLHELRQAPIADRAAVLALVDAAGLVATGIGYVDVHLLASMQLAPGTRLWTRDRRLRAAAFKLGLSAELA